MVMPCSLAAAITSSSPNAATRLNHGLDTGRGSGVEAVTEREEGVAGADPTLGSTI